VCLKSDMQNDINYQNRFTEKETEKVKEKETEKETAKVKEKETEKEKEKVKETETETDEKTFCDDDRFLHNTKRIYALRVSKNREFAFASFSTFKKYLFLKRATTNEKLLDNG
jgi:hypothetical protein